MADDDVLGTRPGASVDDVRAAWRRFARAHHPDVGGDARRFREGAEAYARRLALARRQEAEREVVRAARIVGIHIIEVPRSA